MRKRQIATLSLLAVGIGLTVFALWPEAKKENSSKGQISGVQVEKTLTPEPQNSFSPINTPIPTLMPSPSNLPAASLPTVSNPPSPTPVPARQ
ncbi:hypothetical protein HY946_00305, partial [Candidatus Gottesmanbacteria bacterium]|nr:hypothetical protein [Candidatus Gottesmanbacteria bacterium]